jgi:hypothetical protein
MVDVNARVGVVVRDREFPSLPAADITRVESVDKVLFVLVY